MSIHESFTYILTNSLDSSTNLALRIYEFLRANWQKKTVMNPISSLFCFSAAQTEKNSKTELVKHIGSLYNIFVRSLQLCERMWKTFQNLIMNENMSNRSMHISCCILKCFLQREQPLITSNIRVGRGRGSKIVNQHHLVDNPVMKLDNLDNWDQDV